MSARQASPFGETRPYWLVWRVDETGKSIVRNLHSWNAMLFDTEDEARVYGRMNVFPAYEVTRHES